MSNIRMDTVWEFLNFDKNNTSFTIEGYYLLCGVGDEIAEPCLIVNGNLVLCEKVKRTDKVSVYCEEEVSQRIGFKATIVAVDAKIIIQPAVKIVDVIESTKGQFGRFFPLSDTYKYGYANLGHYTATIENQSIVLAKRQGRIKDLVREKNFLCEVWRINRRKARKGVIFRLLYQLFKLFKHKKLWIISDRVNRADDNGEAFYVFLQTHKPPKTNVVFAISNNCDDYARLLKIGNCVNTCSVKFKILILLCDMNISSHADREKYYHHYEELRDLYARVKFVFLQHGVTKDDISAYLSRYKQKISGFVTAAVPEYNSIKDDAYGYDQKEVWLTGFPRFDRLYNNPKKYITIMPTWRKYLMGDFNGETGNWELKSDFEKQCFYLFYDALINSDRLISSIQECGYKLIFFPHPIMNPYLERFHHDPRVMFSFNTQTMYRDVYAISSMVITDYSSALFDFAYLRKPVFYCQFDKDKFFSGEHMFVKGYFDYERDGFGEVVYDLEHTIDLIIEYSREGCVLKDKYRKRIDSFFAFNDRNNCQRVLDKIMQLQNG